MTTQTIQKAQFDPKVCTYWLLSGALAISCTIVGIPLLLLWFPIGLVVTKAYLERMECKLTDNALKVKKGILTRVEKTIPLEKITDMGMVQGPIMRAFELHTLTVETAGQSGVGSLVSLTGITDAKAFREAVLRQRDSMAAASPPKELPNVAAEHSPNSEMLLEEIKNSLHRIESMMAKRSDA